MLSLFDALETDLGTVAEDAVRQGMRQLRMSGEVRIQWRRYRVSAGRAYLRQGLICLSKALLDTPAKVRETALHELAHIYVFRKHGYKARAHGAQWRKVMERLGVTPSIYHSYSCERKAVAPKFFIACGSCGEEIGRFRPLKGNRIYFHVGCGGKLVRKS